MGRALFCFAQPNMQTLLTLVFHLCCGKVNGLSGRKVAFAGRCPTRPICPENGVAPSDKARFPVGAATRPIAQRKEALGAVMEVPLKKGGNAWVEALD